MALNLSQTASSMGIISGRQRDAERAEWQSRIEEMRLQAFNREELNRQQDTQTTQQMLAGLNFNPVQNYNPFYSTDVRQVPVEAPAPVAAPAPAVAAPAASAPVPAPAAAPAPAPAAGVRLPEAQTNPPVVTGTNIPLRSPIAAQNIADWQARTGQKLPAGIEKFSQGQTTTHLTVPDFNPNLPSRAGLVDAEGVPKIDPNSAGFQRYRQEGAARSAIIQQREQIATGLAIGKYGEAGSPAGQLYGYFFDDKTTAEKRDIATAAMKWFRSDESLAYFMQNPQALAQAKLDPMGFYAAFMSEAPIRDARRQSEMRSEQLSAAPEVVSGKLQPKKFDEKFVANSAKVTDKRVEQLAPMLPKILEKAETKQILSRADALQVDPAAALAVYGLESNFGAAKSNSSAGASGPLQVMPDTFQLMKNWYTNAGNIQKYKIPAAQVEAARNMQFNTAGKIDAGLLVLKYNEYIGNPKNLWGAGYQGNADQVKQFGRPLNAHDGTVMNADYNRGYIALYNAALTALSGTQQAAAPAAAAPAAAAPAAPAKTIAIGDSLAEGFAKANKLEGSYKTGASPKAVLSMLQDYASKNSLQGVTVYLGTGLPNNPAEQSFVTQQIEFIKSQGGNPVVFGTGPGTKANPTTGQNEFLQQASTSAGVEFTGRLMDLYPSVAKDPMGLHLQPKNYQDLYSRRAPRTQQVAAAPAGLVVNAPAAAAAPVVNAPAAAAAPVVNAPAAAAAPVVSAPAVAAVEKPQIKMPEAGTIDPKVYDQFTTQALQMREFTKQLAQNAARSGNPAKALEYIGKIYSTDLDLYRMMGDRGVAEFTRFGDPTRMVGVWSQFTGQKLQLQPRSDGKWDLFSNGKVLAQGVSGSDLIGYAKEDMDAKYLASKTALKEYMFKKSFESGLKIEETVTGERAKALGQVYIDANKITRQVQADVFKAITEGNIKMAQTAFENAVKKKVTMFPDGSGKALITSEDGQYIGVIDASAGTITLNGETVNKAPGSLFVLGSGMPSASIPVFGPAAEKAGVKPPVAGLLVNP